MGRGKGSRLVIRNTNQGTGGVTVVEVEKPHGCRYCPYKAVVRSYIVRHERTHTGERPFPCPECKYSGAQKKDLTHHIQAQHIRTTNVKCDLGNCPKLFKTRVAMQQHKRRNHLVNEALLKDSKKKNQPLPAAAIPHPPHLLNSAGQKSDSSITPAAPMDIVAVNEPEIPLFPTTFTQDDRNSFDASMEDVSLLARLISVQLGLDEEAYIMECEQ